MHKGILLMLVLVAFSGCASTATQERLVEMGVIDAHGVAVAEAAAWNADAVVTGLRMLEIPTELEANIYADRGERELARAIVDPTPGDGRSLVWSATVASAQENMKADIVFDNRGARTVVPLNGTVDDDVLGLDLPAIDSAVLKATAIDVMGEQNGTWGFLAFPSPCGNYYAFYFRDTLAKENPDDAVFLDAEGAVVGRMFVVICSPPPAEMATLLYTVDAVTTASGTFRLDRAHDDLRLLLEPTGLQLPGQTVVATVTTPDGRELTVQMTTGPTGGSWKTQAMEAVAGDYTYTVTLDPGVRSTGSLYVCTAGTAWNPNPAC